MEATKHAFPTTFSTGRCAQKSLCCLGVWRSLKALSDTQGQSVTLIPPLPGPNSATLWFTMPSRPWCAWWSGCEWTRTPAVNQTAPTPKPILYFPYVRGHPFRHLYTIILVLGTPKMVPRVFGSPPKSQNL